MNNIKKININTSKNYDVLIGNNLYSELAYLIKNAVNSHKTAIISDDLVFELYGKKVIESLKKEKYEVSHFIFKHGEASKNIHTLSDIYSFLAKKHISRKDTIIALGGGVVGDIAGFAAATYLRSINFINIPTTLLAMVDSSVGGKTAIDIPEGKNLAGAFYQPSIVICDTSVLSTLDDVNFRSGMGEIIKYALIKDKSLFYNLLDQNISEILNDVIANCVYIKKDIVQSDEFESSQRMTLNFGHTIAHSIEKLENYNGMSHGEAVGAGISYILSAQFKNGLFTREELDLTKKLLQKYNLPLKSGFSIKDLCDNIIFDKKCDNNMINLVLLSSIGNAYIKKISLDECFNFFK